MGIVHAVEYLGLSLHVFLDTECSFYFLAIGADEYPGVCIPKPLLFFFYALSRWKIQTKKNAQENEDDRQKTKDVA